MEFEVFASQEWARLRRAGFLLCGDWHTAEDLAQAALIKVYARWRTLRSPQKASAFTRTALVRTWIDWQRKRSSTEVPTGSMPERSAGGDDAETRVTLLDALAQLLPMQRAVVVLRYWQDLPVEEVARLTGRKPATVRSDAARGLAALKAVLTEKETVR
ncbi:SigE family RNA polymerase sigma factor [Streptomyces sp. RPT161]|uniref:SigE family RNA polymerase sigma factor n=1 Tax=Streptomyces sp. RPT161 TaxID=3015993 RepID=UPI0022B8FB59|nr:SigE family RNA polymerase sigma factor [Streptomyces sp. RPT161]